MLRSFYKNRAAVFFIILATIAAGIQSFRSLPVALYPQTMKPLIHVRLHRFSINNQAFRESYGKSLEAKLAALNHVKDVKGRYHESSASWDVEFDWGVDEEEAKNRVEVVVQGISLPSDWSKFNVNFQRGGGRIFLSLSSDEYDSNELYDLLADRINARINRIVGQEFVFLSKPTSEYVRITLNPDALLSFNLTPPEVERVIGENKYDTSLGHLETANGLNFAVVSDRSSRSIEGLKNLVISEREGRPIRLSDIAQVETLFDTPDHLMRGNGKRGLIAGASPSPEVNIATFCDDFEKQVRAGIAESGVDIHVDVLINPSTFIGDAVDNVSQSVLMGMAIATLVIFLFLSSFWHTLIIALAIPLSLLGGFVVMRIAGMELNLISLGAMALAVGMVVDGSIVVLENVVRHFRQRRPKTPSEIMEVTLVAVAEVRSAVMASLLTTIIVFAPLIFTAPLAYAVLGDLAKVIVCVLIISLCVTLFIVPPLLIGTSTEPTYVWGLSYLAKKFQMMIRVLEQFYIRTLGVLLESVWIRRLYLSSLIGVGTLGMYLLLNHVKREVMAEPDSDKIWLGVNFEEQRNLQDAEARIIPIETILQEEFGDRFTHYFSNVWQSGGRILCNLKNKKDVEQFKKDLENRFTNSPENKFWVYKWTPSALRLPSPPAVKFTVEGTTYDERRDLLVELINLVEEVEGVGRVEAFPNMHRHRSFHLHFDDVLLAVSGRGNSELIRSEVESAVSYALNEKRIQKWTYGSENISVKIGYPKDYIKSATGLSNFLVRIDDYILPIRNFAHVTLESGYSNIFIENGQEEVGLEAWPKESYTGERATLAEKIKGELSEAGVDMNRLVFMDTETEINENILSLLYAMILALILIWIVISLQFAQISHVAIIMMAIPLGMIGVTYSLYGFSSTLSVNSMLGMILLCGTAVNNSIIFLDFFTRQSSHKPLQERLIDTACLRFRPILITTMTTILGMLPIALGIGHGAEILQPLGIAICGGLGVSTCLTLITIPVIIFLLNRDGKVA